MRHTLSKLPPFHTTAFLAITAVLLTPVSCSDEDAQDAPLTTTPMPGTAPPGHAPSTTPQPAAPPDNRRTEVPDEIVGAWQHGWIDFALWENYEEGRYAGRNATPSREAMIFKKNGDAKFYRYEFLFNLYEELIDCEGTVAFHDGGTFTFRPTRGRKRFYDTRNSFRNVDRPLTAEELMLPKLAGTRAYRYDGSSVPPAIEIRVPTSAPYRWYKKEP